MRSTVQLLTSLLLARFAAVDGQDAAGGSGQDHVAGVVGQCHSDLDCSLNGRCDNGRCRCEPAWSGAPDCSSIRFVPGTRASGYRHHEPYLAPNSSSWGGGGWYDNTSGLYLMWVSEMAGNCGMATWTSNSHTIRASSRDPLGLYIREAVQFPVWTHESVVTRGPRGEWVAFMSYNVPQTRPICTGCWGGLTNRTCKEPKQRAFTTAHHQYSDAGDALRGRMGTKLSDWDPTYMSWAPADGVRSSSAWSQPVLVGAPVPQMDTNFAAVIDDDGRLVGLWRCVTTTEDFVLLFTQQNELRLSRADWPLPLPDALRGSDHHRDGTASKAKSTIHLVTASDWRDNSTYVFEDHDLLFSGKAYPGGVEDPFVYKDKQGNYHAVFHLLYNTRPADSVCGNGRFLGGHAFSPAGDGKTWTFTGVAYDGNVTYSDGSTDKVCNGDRPKLLFDTDGVTPVALTSAAGEHPWTSSVPGLDSDQTYTLLRPVARAAED